MSNQSYRPHVFLNMAMSIDGKISTRDGTGPRFTGTADEVRLREIRTHADAILVGAGTIISDDPTFTEDGIYKDERVQRGLSPQPIKVVVSGSGSVPESARMFEPNGAPALVFTTTRIPSNRKKMLDNAADAVHIVGDDEVDFTQIVELLGRDYNVKNLLIEGGGQVNFAMFREQLIDEVYLTLCPRVIGGRDVPTPVEGAGFDFIDLIELELLDHRIVEGENFLHYRVVHRNRENA
ncbi:MAG: dihydrofolate reductase family protein [Candidatus Poribacteria bacterium]|nr:dihydrofolate reductase family protein [Candidatus Poribacteria bacterium]MDE0504523.1 dihydrofolate reductase family protein [Candidatus Poribacteria bacterium]